MLFWSVNVHTFASLPSNEFPHITDEQVGE